MDPYDPHAVASLRISAYAKATVMMFLDNLIAWGDSYYSQFTAETVSQAEQLYILADLILGPAPQSLRAPNLNQGGAPPATYASSAQKLDAFSNVLVNIENVVVAPEPPQAFISGVGPTPSLPSTVGSPLFCIPPNGKMLAYWDTVSQRLSNIRSGKNLQGMPQPLPLYAPPINPLSLIGPNAVVPGPQGTGTFMPIYRFSIYLQKAMELTNDVRAFGSLLLAALEKQDAETITLLRANQELNIQTKSLMVKTTQVTEAQDQIAALTAQQAVVNVRFNYYSTVEYTNTWEDAAIALQLAALYLNGGAVVLDATAAVASLIPTGTVGVAGFGATPNALLSYGGENIAKAASSFANVARGFGGLINEGASMASTMGSYRRRKDEWTLQENIASAELLQLASQITAAQDRLSIAQTELDIQNTQISNAQAISDFLTNKYTTAQLYSWMASQLTTVYFQAYQLALALATQAQNAYQYEVGASSTFIQSQYWDTTHKGLTAGEGLIFDLRRMEAQYVANNSRELELTKHISLALTSPVQLVMLRETGQCTIRLDEALFDYDHPGQYFRRLRSVAVTIPCVTGPYSGVNATLTLTSAMVRVQQPGGDPTKFHLQSASSPPVDTNNVVYSPLTAPGASVIATSSGQSDAGLFDVNLRDERWLPFEGQGAISNWNLALDRQDNNFDFSTITDVVLHIRYTARGGGDPATAAFVRSALKAQVGPTRSILVSVRGTFGNAYYSFFNPANATSTSQTLTLSLSSVVFPFSNLGSVQIDSLVVFVLLSTSVSTVAADYSFAANSSTVFQLTQPTNITVPCLSGTIQLATGGLAAPQTLTLMVPFGTFDPTVTQDIVLAINYSIKYPD